MRRSRDSGKTVRCLALLLCAVLTLTLPLSATALAADGDGRTIRVGWYASGDNSDPSRSTGAHGYDYTYLQALSQYTGWEYEYVNGTWDECLKRLETGEIDMLGFVSKTDERMEKYGYPNLPSEEWFIGDQMRISQILTNLLSNAMKFTPEGGVKMKIIPSMIDEAHMRFCFEISDTGIGMSHEYTGRLWQPFEQADSSISRRFGGTGLGLAITKSLVDIMGGSIRVESELGVGSVFSVELTLGRTEQPQETGQNDFTDIRALIVDDDRSSCDYIKLLFDRCGARSETALSGTEALAAFQKSLEQNDRFTLCMVDWRMPGMDGVATVKEIRRLAGEEVPIIIVTAYDYTEIAEQVKDAGVTMFVAKPLFQSSLFDLLSNISGAQKPQNVSTLQKDKTGFSGARVLLAEDNKMNMEVATRILQSEGLTVDGVWNGMEAVSAFEASEPGTYKAILMDVHMPEMDGYQATKAIRRSKHPVGATIPVIAMTADAFAENVAEAYSVGMNDHIAKPVDVDILFKKLRKYIPS